MLVLPSAKISTAVEGAQYVIHWRSAFKGLEALVREHDQFVLSDKDNSEFRLMSRFVSETANVLRLVQDTLRPCPPQRRWWARRNLHRNQIEPRWLPLPTLRPRLKREQIP